MDKIALAGARVREVLAKEHPDVGLVGVYVQKGGEASIVVQVKMPAMELLAHVDYLRACVRELVSHHEPDAIGEYEDIKAKEQVHIVPKEGLH